MFRLWMAASMAAFCVCAPAHANEITLVNGLGMYIGPGPMGWIAPHLIIRGHRVTILNHMEGRRLDEMPEAVVCHSLGCNAVLKRASELPASKRPKLVITIDPGRAPLFHRAPKGVRVVNLYCPYHPIGGQRISGAAHNHEICGTAHIAMPCDARVIAIIIKEIEGL